MKVLVYVFSILIATTAFSQQMVVDYVSPFQGDMAAVSQGEKWGFINDKGELVVDFRSDLVANQKDGDSSYPAFDSDRALIKKKIDGIWHYGFIDNKGEAVIPPVYVNATDFHNGHAIVLKVNKQVLGRNEVLGKDVISYSYNEVVINTQGEVVTFLRGPINLQYDKEFLKENPRIKSNFISNTLVATPHDEKGWVLNPIKASM